MQCLTIVLLRNRIVCGLGKPCDLYLLPATRKLAKSLTDQQCNTKTPYEKSSHTLKILKTVLSCSGLTQGILMKMLSRVCSILLLCMFANAADFTGKKLEGKIILPDEVTGIKEGSWLKVELVDARKQDVARKEIAKKIITTPELKFVKGQAIPFSIDLKGELDDRAEYTLSAVLNDGWGPKEGSKEWIRKGDLLTDTNFPVTLESCSKPGQPVCKANQDLRLIKYN